jgi:hypothetical protein
MLHRKCIGSHSTSRQASRINDRHPTPTSGAHTDGASKISGQMRLVGEPACKSNGPQPLPRRCHHERGPLESTCYHISHGRGSEALFECSRKVTFAQRYPIGQISNRHLRSKLLLYVLESQLGLPCGETAASLGVRSPGRHSCAIGAHMHCGSRDRHAEWKCLHRYSVVDQLRPCVQWRYIGEQRNLTGNRAGRDGPGFD